MDHSTGEQELEMDITTATREYESWLASLVTLHQPDLDYKHERMADPDDPFPFFGFFLNMIAISYERVRGAWVFPRRGDDHRD